MGTGAGTASWACSMLAALPAGEAVCPCQELLRQMLPHTLGPKRDRLGGCNGLAEFGSFSFIRAAEPADAGGLKWLVLGQAGAMSRCKGAWHRLPASSCRAELQGAPAEATGPYPRGMHLEGALLLIRKARKRPLRRGLDGCSLLLLFLILLLQFC